MVMLPPLVDQSEGFLPLTEFQIQFAGAAQLVHDQGEYRWEVAFWRDNRDALTAVQSIPLRFSEEGHRLVAVLDPEKDRHTGIGMLAPDEAVVMVANEAIANERSVPKTWQVLSDNEVLVGAASHAVAATVILHYGINVNLATLAKQVNYLRRQCGKALKILVREDNISIRYELVLLTLGANAIIPRNTPFAQVEIIVDSVQGQLFSRPVPDDYHASLAAAMRDSTTGYVPAPRFVTLVREAVERSRTVRLPNVLLQMPLGLDVAAIDALNACHMRRTGDLCTASGDSVYLFFFACHVDDVGKAMERVFERRPAELFRGELRCGDRDTIFSVLDELEKTIAEVPAPDYTGLVERAEPMLSTTLPKEPEPAPEVAESAPTPMLPIWGSLESATSGAEANVATRRSPRAASLPLKTRRAGP